MPAAECIRRLIFVKGEFLFLFIQLICSVWEMLQRGGLSNAEDYVKRTGCHSGWQGWRSRALPGGSAGIRKKEDSLRVNHDSSVFGRLARVKELLLRETIPIESIASRCGWQSPARLRVFFQREEGCSMRTWRQRNLYG